MAAVDALELGVQAYLAELSEAELSRLIAITRPDLQLTQRNTQCLLSS